MTTSTNVIQNHKWRNRTPVNVVFHTLCGLWSSIWSDSLRLWLDQYGRSFVSCKCGHCTLLFLPLKWRFTDVLKVNGLTFLTGLCALDKAVCFKGHGPHLWRGLQKWTTSWKHERLSGIFQLCTVKWAKFWRDPSINDIPICTTECYISPVIVQNNLSANWRHKTIYLYVVKPEFLFHRQIVCFRKYFYFIAKSAIFENILSHRQIIYFREY